MPLEPEPATLIPETTRSANATGDGVEYVIASLGSQSIRWWWEAMGAEAYPRGGRLLIAADFSRHAGIRALLWNLELQALANEKGLEIHLCHLPPGTMRWNSIEHRMLCLTRHYAKGKSTVNITAAVTLLGRRADTANPTSPLELGYEQPLQHHSAPGTAVMPSRLFQQFPGDWNRIVRPSR